MDTGSDSRPIEPYLDIDGRPTNNCGELYVDSQPIGEPVRVFDAAGWQVHAHAMGDPAVRDTGRTTGRPLNGKWEPPDDRPPAAGLPRTTAASPRARRGPRHATAMGSPRRLDRGDAQAVHRG